MNDYELSKLADSLDEDAVKAMDVSLEDIDKKYPKKKKSSETDSFKSKYLEFYDDIKTSPYDDW